MPLRVPTVVLVVAFLCVSGKYAVGQAPAKKSPRRDLQNRWEYTPNLGANFTPGAAKDPKLPLLPEMVRAPDLQTRIYTMQRIVRESAVQPANRAELYQAAVEQLAEDVSGLTSRQALLASVSAARALASNREELEKVYALVQEKPFAAETVERDLVKMGSTAGLPAWRERVEKGTTKLGLLLTALDGLSVGGNESDRAALEAILMDSSTLLPIQLAAAQALGSCAKSGLEGTAKELLASSRPQKELLAANILLAHKSSDAAAVAEQILDSGNEQAEAVAYQVIARIDPEKGRALAKDLVKHPESAMRNTAIDVLNAMSDRASVGLMALALDDENLNVREKVRDNLIAKVKVDALKPLINDVIGHYINGEKWQGVEQAINLAVALKQYQRAPKLLELLEHPRSEISIRAAWGLQVLTRLPPEILTQIHEHCEVTTKKLVEGKPVSFEEELRVAFCFEALGLNQYRPASDMLMLYVPKNDQKMHVLTRTSAVYALGLIWKGRENKSLMRQLAGRMNDVGLTPEPGSLRYTAALSLGLIGDESMLGALETANAPEPDPVGIAARWAINYIKSKK
ncbi:MAG: HEAT repeat domain-containing protein [Aureliella sp.]